MVYSYMLWFFPAIRSFGFQISLPSYIKSLEAEHEQTDIVGTFRKASLCFTNSLASFTDFNQRFCKVYHQ